MFQNVVISAVAMTSNQSCVCADRCQTLCWDIETAAAAVWHIFVRDCLTGNSVHKQTRVLGLESCQPLLLDSFDESRRLDQSIISVWNCCFNFPSQLWCCWLGVRKVSQTARTAPLILMFSLDGLLAQPRVTLVNRASVCVDDVWIARCCVQLLLLWIVEPKTSGQGVECVLMYLLDHGHTGMKYVNCVLVCCGYTSSNVFMSALFVF